MATLNKVTLIGYLGRDPEMHYADDGTAICNVPIATSHAWTDKASGERREKPNGIRLPSSSALPKSLAST